MRQFWIYSVVGAASGIIAAVVGSFLTPKQEFGQIVNSSFDAHNLYPYNRVYEVLPYFILGALVCSVIALLANEPRGVKVQFRSFWVGFFVGGGLCAAMDSLIYYICFRMAMRGNPTGIISAEEAERIHDLGFLMYYAFVPTSLAVALGVSIGLNRFVAMRSLVASGLAIAISGTLIHLALLLVIPILFVKAANNPRSVDISDALTPLMIAHLFGMGLGAAMAFAVAQSVYKPAWLKGIGGRLEGRTYNIPAPIAVIGCREDVNLFLPPDGTIAPVHAQVDTDDGDRHLIRAAMGEVRVNGNAVQEHWLADNDVLEIGTYRFRYRNRLTPIAQPAVMPVPNPIVVPSQSGTLTLVDPMGGAHEIMPGKTVLGRDDGLAVSLAWESTVSRRHAEITLGPNGCTITDLGSSNGTFINNIAVVSGAPLKPGDELRLGRCVLKVKQVGVARWITAPAIR